MPIAPANPERQAFDLLKTMLDGAWRWILGRGKIVVLEEGKPARVQGLSIDITDRKEAGEHLRRSEALYRAIGESIDYGVMERAGSVKAIPASFGWSDVGSWNALPEVIEGDDDGIVAIETSGLISIDSSDILVYGNGKMVALVGVDNLIVVDTTDAVLVCRSDRAQDVKKIVEKLQLQNLTEYL